MENCPAAVFLNGALNDDWFRSLEIFRQNCPVYCADGGANHAYRLGLKPRWIIGDMDSVSVRACRYFKKIQVPFLRYPKEKNETDTELLFQKITEEEKYSVIYVFGGLDSHLGHTLGNIFLISRYPGLIFLSPEQTVLGIGREQRVIEDQRGKKFSLLPLTGDIEGIRISGSLYDCEDLNLQTGQTRTLSNQAVSERLEISCRKGRMIAVFEDIIQEEKK